MKFKSQKALKIFLKNFKKGLTKPGQYDSIISERDRRIKK